MDEITLHTPLDMHVHFREGSLLREVAYFTAQHFAAALVMPNLARPVRTLRAVEDYRRQINAAVGQGHPFQPYLTLFFDTDFDREFLKRARPQILAVKFYPRGLTTNSEHGLDPSDSAVMPVLEAMEELGIPLCVHAEAPGYVMDREREFHGYIHLWARTFPGLKIIVEHLSDLTSAELLDLPNVYATITAHHLLLTLDDVVGGLLRPHHFCKPVPKGYEDRERLRNLAMNFMAADRDWSDKVMFGSDSAPHAESAKVCASGCAGVFTAPIALQLLASLFDEHGALDHLQAFVSDNARKIYGLEPPAKVVQLVRRPFRVPEKYGAVVPFGAGQEVDWSVARVS